jgi:hypothetical protein
MIRFKELGIVIKQGFSCENPDFERLWINSKTTWLYCAVVPEIN